MLENKDFYPTPKELIKKMISSIYNENENTNYYKYPFSNYSFLEPSAGKGDIAIYLKEYFGNSIDLDCIESDIDLTATLKGKELRVVSDDFLDFYTHKTYDYIIMNPPFSNGDQHLLKALELRTTTGCGIVCLLNAETINNPYSNTRKDLLRKLGEAESKIEFLQNAFSTAERKTDVEIAMITIERKEVLERKSNLFEELKKGKNEEFHEYEHKEVTKNNTIENMIDKFNFEVEATMGLYKEITSFKKLFSEEVEQKPYNNILDNFKIENSQNGLIEQIRHKYWYNLFDNSEFTKNFTSDLKREYESILQKLKGYDFNKYNILSIKLDIQKRIIENIDDTILRVFDNYTSKAWYDQSENIYLYNGWKTNKAHKINYKIIDECGHVKTSWDRSKAFHYTNYVATNLKDLEQVINYFTDIKSIELNLEEILKNAEKYQESKKIRTEYFYIDFFKKGTAHIYFDTSKKAIDRLNAWVGVKRAWLPPDYGKNKYEDMAEDEKEVIKNFHKGNIEEYNEIVKDGFYLKNNDGLLLIKK